MDCSAGSSGAWMEGKVTSSRSSKEGMEVSEDEPTMEECAIDTVDDYMVKDCAVMDVSVKDGASTVVSVNDGAVNASVTDDLATVVSAKDNMAAIISVKDDTAAVVSAKDVMAVVSVMPVMSTSISELSSGELYSSSSVMGQSTVGTGIHDCMDAT